MRKHSGEVFFCGFMLLSSVLYLINSLKIPFGSIAKPGPGFLPVILGTIAIALSSFLLISSVRLCIQAGRGQDGDAQHARQKTPLKGFVRILACLAIMILFVLAMENLGIIISVFLLVFSLSIFLGLKRWFKPIVLGALFSVSIYMVFIHWLHVPLSTWPIWF